jgi:ATP-dependent RNA helicase DHX37/DHR1
MEDAVMAAVAGQDVVFVCGATGSGKTTQVPQWLLEHGYRGWGQLCVTQPR